MKLIISRTKVVALLLSLFMTACTLPDPAPAFCEQHGGHYELRHYREDALRGYCVFPDNSICEAAAFYQGRCQPERSLGQANPLPTGANIAAAVPAPKTLDELLNSAPLIFIGEIGPVVQYGTFAGYRPDGKMLTETDPAGNPLPQVPFTDFTLKVEEVLRDDGAIASGKPIILRMGGYATPEMKKLTENSDYPFSYTGDRHLFLLTPGPDGKTYGLHYGPWSRLLIDGKILRVSNGARQVLQLDSKKPISLQEFKDRVKR